MPSQHRASGCLFGLALGDALGAPTEFLNMNAIRRRFPSGGPQEPLGLPARVTDDTQMALAVGAALRDAEQPYSAATLEGPLRQAFIEWNESPDNNRAPGRTCMTACTNLAAGLPWREATVNESTGCGANMRVAPVGLLPHGHGGVSANDRAAIAQFQAALTHGHPTALAASDLTAAAIADLAAGGSASGLPLRLREYAAAQRQVYHFEWLGTLWQQPDFGSPEQFIAHGWDECLAALDRLDSALAAADRESDPCLVTGAGWVAEEAFATGMLCFLLFPTNSVAALRRAAVSSGDSDSIACLAGAFAGAAHGLAAWPQDWIARVEYREQIAALGALWD